jgi:putative drug exporter of the RND superfamily
MRRPVVSLVLSVGLMLALALPVLDYKTGEAGIRTLPERFESKQGFIALEHEFGVATADSVEVVVDGPVTRPATRTGIQRIAAEMRANPEFRQVTTEVYLDGDLAVIEALPTGDSRDEQALAAVGQLREEEMPGARVLVGGQTAESIDYFALTDLWLPILITFVLALSFILLTIAFRSIVVAVTAILLNLLLDATIIRSVILPATMKLLGKWNWYLPRRLEWLPDFHVEGAK